MAIVVAYLFRLERRLRTIERILEKNQSSGDQD
jgi:hypothetical protein